MIRLVSSMGLSARRIVPLRAIPVTPVAMIEGISSKVMPPMATMGRCIPASFICETIERYPSSPNTGRNIVQEAIATFVLVFAICGLNQVLELNAGVGKLLVFGIIVAIGMSLGGLTGYALNPARDLGPRIAHAILPIKGKGSSNFKYGLIVPIFGPIIGGIVAVLLYNVIPW